MLPSLQRIFLFLLCPGLLLCACDRISLPQPDQQIVVDGWIEDGGYPVVILTSTIPVSTEYTDVSELGDHVLRWAKVTVSGPDGDVILTGKRSDDYTPPYIYTTVKMKGCAGETYSISVDYGDTHAYASTTIPPPVPLDGIRAEKADDGSSWRIVATLSDSPGTRDYYRFFVAVEGEDTSYSPSFMGLVNDDVLGDSSEIPVYRGFKVPVTDFNPYYAPGDVVRVKFVTMDAVSYRYWSDFEDLTTFSRNPFFPSSVPIHSNVAGGLGCWAGYGATEYRVVIPVE